jgi:thiamine pyrophosphokinase
LAIARYLRTYKTQPQLTLVGPLLKENDEFDHPVIFVDGGANFRKDNIGLSVGDGDSFAGEMDEPLNSNKNYSDLAYVLAGIPHHFRRLNLRGFLGGRRDHELLNLGEVCAFLKHQPRNSTVSFDDKVCCFGKGEWQLESHQTFSLMCLSPVKVQLTGELKYPIAELTELSPLSSLGLSNEGLGHINLKCDGPLLMFYSDKF